MEWILISENLPPMGDRVLCSGIGQECAYVFIGYQDIRGQWFECNNGDYIDGGYGDDYPALITHWMPLPHPASE